MQNDNDFITFSITGFGRNSARSIISFCLDIYMHRVVHYMTCCLSNQFAKKKFILSKDFYLNMKKM